MFDYSSQMGTTYINSGIIDYFRIPKRSYYWYRNAYAKVAPPTWPAAGTAAGLKLTSSTTTLSAVDGTQDAWLLVTVVDASGKPISNNVPVTLTIKSGPGEFPTGPSITFTPPGGGAASDIAIRDGQAAIEFRTYYSGTSIIEATSTGLTSATRHHHLPRDACLGRGGHAPGAGSAVSVTATSGGLLSRSRRHPTASR